MKLKIEIDECALGEIIQGCLPSVVTGGFRTTAAANVVKKLKELAGLGVEDNADVGRAYVADADNYGGFTPAATS